MISHSSAHIALDPARAGAFHSWLCESENGGSIILVFQGGVAVRFSVNAENELTIEPLAAEELRAVAEKVRREAVQMGTCLERYTRAIG